jgi:hypothetical protein
MTMNNKMQRELTLQLHPNSVSVVENVPYHNI